MIIRKRVVAIAAATATVGGVLTALASIGNPAAAAVPGKVSGAIMTTDNAGVRVNQNHYATKPDVYLSGGPNNSNAHFLEAGDYFFAVLDPSRQSDPNDEGQGNLSWAAGDAAVNRTFHANGDGTVSALTTTKHVIAPVAGSLAIADSGVIQLGFNPDFADTDNAGGVYIAAVCQYVPTSDNDATPQAVQPKDCKYDAFKVDKPDNCTSDCGGQQISAPTAEKTAVPTHDRKVHWNIVKTVDATSDNPTRHSESFAKSTAQTLNYSVTATKVVDYDTYGVTGSITVSNPNLDPMTVDVAEDGIADPSLAPLSGSTCNLDGSGSLVVPGKDTTTLDDGQNSVTYTCTVTAAPDESIDYTNTATVTYDIGNGAQELPVASDPFKFPAATLSSDSAPETVHVTDAFDSPTAVALNPSTASDTYTWNYQRQVFNSNCHTYDNTATITETSQSDSDHVTFCGPIAGGLTMGWWQNKNGQKILGANVSKACAAFNSYLPTLGNHGSTKYLPDAYAGNTASKYYTSPNCTLTTDKVNYLPAFNLNVFAAANASSTGTPMVEGQFLTTALNTAPGYVNQGAGVPGLDPSTGVVTPPALRAAASATPAGLGLPACISVANLLTQAAGQYVSYAATKTSVTQALIPLLTSINQNQAQTCAP